MEKELIQTKSDVIKVVLYGPECTGKTTLCKQLSSYYNTVWVKEYSREYVLYKKQLGEELSCQDVLPIAQGQINNENRQLLTANKLMFCDTCLLETKVYAGYYYPHCNFETLEEAIKSHSYHLYFLTDIDVPWKEDGVRDKPFEREIMFQKFKNELEKYKISYVLLSGNPQERLTIAIKEIETFFNEKKS